MLFQSVKQEWRSTYSEVKWKRIAVELHFDAGHAKLRVTDRLILRIVEMLADLDLCMLGSDPTYCFTRRHLNPFDLIPNYIIQHRCNTSARNNREKKAKLSHRVIGHGGGLA